MIIEEKVSNFRVTALDSAVVCDFDPVEGADGYIISFFNEEDTEQLTELFYRYGRLIHNRRPEHLNDTVYRMDVIVITGDDTDLFVAFGYQIGYGIKAALHIIQPE